MRLVFDVDTAIEMVDDVAEALGDAIERRDADASLAWAKVIDILQDVSYSYNDEESIDEDDDEDFDNE